MTIRTKPDLVRGVLGKDYGEAANLTQYMRIANAVTTRVAACASKKGKSLSSSELEIVETWLAAHYYTKMDPVYASKTTGKASASFVRDPACPEPYKQGAIDADYSGCLKALLYRQTAGGAWLGVAQDQYDDQNEG